MNTKIYAISDSHQEARNLSVLLSGIHEREQNSQDPFLVLDCGDLFKGIYDKDLSVNAYIKLKKLHPNCQIITTLGNNDFGFNKKDFEYLKGAIKKFSDAGIDVLCGNLLDEDTDEYSDLVKKFKIIEINNKKILVTGFCLNTSIIKNFGLKFENAKTSLINLISNLSDDYDNIFVLNHHWYSYSLDLYEFAKDNAIKIDLIVGGHEHSRIEPDYERNIYYPLSFARSLYEIDFGNKVNFANEISLDDSVICSDFEKDILNYEKKVKLFEPIAKRVLNLVKYYSEPCALGTFISDNMKKYGNTDIAFHSTGFTMYPLKTNESDIITKYDIERVICAPTPIVKIEISTQELKQVFENATLKRMYKNNGNSRFIQCSGNIKITGKGNPIDKTYKIIQIEINGEKLLDENQNPIDKNRKFTCTIDEFISKGEQGYEVLKNIPSQKVLWNDCEIPLNILLTESLKAAQDLYPKNSQYPSFEIVDL